MVDVLREFCLRYRVHFDTDPRLLPGSLGSWVIDDVSGKRWVVKSKTDGDEPAELLKNLSLLHGPFLSPQPVSEPEDPFILYPYIEGRLLSEGLYEEPAIMEQVEEVAGRVQAAMRSLILVPFYQEIIRLKEPGRDRIIPIADRFSADRLEMANLQNKHARQKEIANSFHWMNGKLLACCTFLESNNLWSGTELGSYQERMLNSFSIHVPIVGTNLAHCSFQPEHLILCADGRIGVVGWCVEPRPRFYMKYTYWAWSLLHSNDPDPVDRYRSLLAREIAVTFRNERCRVLSFCILEQLVLALDGGRNGGPGLPDEKVAHARELFVDCVGNMA